MKFILIAILFLPAIAFAQWAAVIAGSVPVSATPPAYDAEIATRLSETSGNSTSVMSVSATVAVNKRVVVCISWVSGTQTLTSVTDSQSNTYAIDKNYQYNTISNIAIVSANITTQLTSSDTITVNWGSAGFTFRGVAGFSVTNTNTNNASAVDQTTSATAFGTAVSAAASTTAAATVFIGIVAPETTSVTYGSSSWTVIGAAQDFGGTNRRNYVQTTASSAGSKDPSGTMSGNNTWGVIWVAYKP